MPKTITSTLLQLFPAFFFAFIAWYGVFKQIKAENISFKEYLIRRKNRVYMALFVILFSIGYGIYSIAMVPH